MLQATYKGHPLYTYAGDTAPGQVKGNGLGGVWHALRVNAISAVSANSLMMGAGSSPSPKASSSMRRWRLWRRRLLAASCPAAAAAFGGGALTAIFPVTGPAE